ncbi:MAG: hypothetical protein J6C15_05885 [Bacteroidaceae bacterium]|nr:hypothetical protein [Bacteroidaceae bacterium]
MQELNAKCTIENGVITIAQGVERIEEGTFCEVDFNELYVPASVKTLEYPFDLSEELEADIYLYGADTAILFSEQAMWKIVKARIFVMPEFQADYVEQLDQTLSANWRQVISIKPMSADRRHHYGAIKVRKTHEEPMPQQRTQLMALDAEYRRLLAKWEERCAEPFAAALVELRAEEENFKSSFKLVERPFWLFPFCDKPQPKKARNRISFALQYGQYLVDNFNTIVKRINSNTTEVDALMRDTDGCSISSTTKRLTQLCTECQQLIDEGVDKLHSLRIHIPDLKAERPKLVAKPTFSFKRTLISIGLFLCVCLPLIARFIAVNSVQEMCFWLWGIVLIAFCLYLVWWLNGFVLVIRHRSDGSVEITEERESKKSSKL